MPLRKSVTCCAKRAILSSWVMVVSTLTGCSPTPQLEGAFSEYRTRLSRVLDVSLSAAQTPEVLQLPATATSYQPLPSAELTLIEFQALQQCGIGSLIAQRNTALGKTQQPSQRLIYETRFIALLDDCIGALQASHSSLADRLRDIRLSKLEQRPVHWGNMIQNSSEIKLALSRSNEYLSVTSSDRGAKGIRALEYLTQLRSPTETNVEHLERMLQQLDKSRLPATMWRTQRLLLAELNGLTEVLSPLLQDLPCPNNQASQQVKILRNVFYLFFIEQIQGVGSKLNNYHYQLLPVWQQWLDEEALSEEFKRFIYQQSEQGFADYQEAVHQHVEIWQQLFTRCNLSPKAPGA